MKKYGDHPYFESFRERDYQRYRDEVIEREREGEKRRRPVVGRVLQVVDQQVSLSTNLI